MTRLHREAHALKVAARKLRKAGEQAVATLNAVDEQLFVLLMRTVSYETET